MYLIAPASANTIAKLAHGQADNLLTATALAAACPVVIAPAMNNRMYAHPATQANLELLAGRGVTVIAPGEGELASHGEYGVGRMAEPAQLLGQLEATLCRQSSAAEAQSGTWRGRRVLISAGGTREPIDSVRYIGNRSSGRMGLALAAQAIRRGAQVTLVIANVNLPAPDAARVIEVRTAAELAKACRNEFENCDMLLMAAAVADFRPRDPAATKLKKDQGTPQVELEPTEDVISGLASVRRPDQVVVGFAAEHGQQAVAYGRAKLEGKRLDAVVVNDIAEPGIGFDSRENEVTIVTPSAERRVARMSKELIADAVLDEVERLLTGKETDDRALRADADRAAGV